MSDVQVARWAGAFGVAGLVVFLVALPLYFVGPPRPCRTPRGSAASPAGLGPFSPRVVALAVRWS